jgi:hypothetical protein
MRSVLSEMISRREAADKEEQAVQRQGRPKS